jgi:hypothetical protein
MHATAVTALMVAGASTSVVAAPANMAQMKAKMAANAGEQSARIRGLSGAGVLARIPDCLAKRL